jgi:hypothetical protein
MSVDKVNETVPQAVSVYGVYGERVKDDDPFVLKREELKRLGYTLLDGGMTEAALSSLRVAVEAVYREQADATGANLLNSSVDAGVARCLLAYDKRFFRLATNATLLRFCHSVFGESFLLLQQNGLINRPAREHYQVRWHRDLPFQHWVSTEPIAIAALFCLDDFNVATGGTWALLGSHLQPDFPSEAFVRAHETVMTARAGTFIVMDAMMFHRAGRNTSSGLRRGVNHLIGRPFLAQQIDIPRMLDRDPPSDGFLSRYLGYHWAPAPTVEAWRAARLNPAS